MAPITDPGNFNGQGHTIGGQRCDHKCTLGWAGLVLQGGCTITTRLQQAIFAMNTGRDFKFTVP